MFYIYNYWSTAQSVSASSCKSGKERSASNGKATYQHQHERHRRRPSAARQSGKHKHQVNGGPSSITMCRRRSCTGWTEGMSKVSCMVLGVWGLVFGVRCLGFGVWCLGFGAGRFLPGVRRRQLTARNLHRGGTEGMQGGKRKRMGQQHDLLLAQT